MIIQDTNIDASILKRHGLREVEYSWGNKVAAIIWKTLRNFKLQKRSH